MQHATCNMQHATCNKPAGGLGCWIKCGLLPRPCRVGDEARGFVFGLGGLLVAVAPALFAKKKSVAVVARQRSRLVTLAALAYLCVDMCCAMCLDMCLDMLGKVAAA